MESRPLLPKPLGKGVSAAGGLEIPSSQLLPKRTKAPGRTSCDTCRKRKTACGAQRPVCSACQARGSECTYENRDKLASADVERGVLERLKNLPESESIALLRQLRGEDSHLVSPALSSDNEQQPNRQLGETPSPYLLPSTVQQPLATTASGLTLELMTRYPVAYPTPLPFDVESIDVEAVVVPPVPSREKIEYPYCDGRLSHLDISKWTSVPLGSKLAARLISSYLRMDHPILGLFDADLFLRDLVSVQHNFCSSMLVNAVLAWSCQSYSSRELIVAKYRLSFLEEAIKLWDEEQHRNTLTSVAASHLITLTASCHGQHDVSARFHQESIAMSKRMGLYGATEEGSAKQWLDNHQEWIRAASHTSWGAYCAITLLSLRNQKPLVEAPPLLPIPSKLGSVIERVKGERYESYPTPDYMGQTFNKLCELYRIAHEILWTYYGGDKSDTNSSDGDSPSNRVSIKFAEEKLRELLDWSSSVPLELVRTDTSPHPVVLLHTYFHCLLLDLIRPLYLDTEQQHQLSSFDTSQPNGDIEALYQASVDQIKRLVLFYSTKMETPTVCILWQTSLVYLFNDLLREYRTSNSKCKHTAQWNFYFRLCMGALKRIAQCFVLTQEVFKGLLSLAVRDGALEASEAEEIIDNMRQAPSGRKKKSGLDSNTHDASLVLDLDLAITHREQSTLSAMTAEFGKLAMRPGGPSDGMHGDKSRPAVPNGDKKPARKYSPDHKPKDRPSGTRDSGGKRSGGKPAAPDDGFPVEELTD